MFSSRSFIAFIVFYLSLGTTDYISGLIMNAILCSIDLFVQLTLLQYLYYCTLKIRSFTFQHEYQNQFLQKKSLLEFQLVKSIGLRRTDILILVFLSIDMVYLSIEICKFFCKAVVRVQVTSISECFINFDSITKWYCFYLTT